MFSDKCPICNSNLNINSKGIASGVSVYCLTNYNNDNLEDHYELYFNSNKQLESESFNIDRYRIYNYFGKIKGCVIVNNYAIFTKEIFIKNIRLEPTTSLQKLQTYLIFS